LTGSATEVLEHGAGPVLGAVGCWTDGESALTDVLVIGVPRKLVEEMLSKA
jgi:hypothetical protein